MFKVSKNILPLLNPSILLLLPLTLGRALHPHFPCGDGWYHRGPTCYKFIHGRTSVNFTQAQALCRTMGDSTYLIHTDVVRDKDELHYVKKHLKSIHVTTDKDEEFTKVYWTGGTFKDGIWWDDFRNLTYENYFPDIHSKGSEKDLERCLSLNAQDILEVTAYLINCNSPVKNVICTKPAQIHHSVKAEDEVTSTLMVVFNKMTTSVDSSTTDATGQIGNSEFVVQIRRLRKSK